MGSTGRNDRRGPWSYHGEPTGSNSYTSISSGTVSTGYTTSANSRLSWMSMEAARHFQEMEMEEAVMDLKFVQSPETAREKKMKQIKILAKEFFGGPSAAKISAEGGDLSVLERWFRELDVGWVLHIADGTPSGELEHALHASSWIPALSEIVDTFRLTLRFLLVPGSTEEEEPATESDKEQNMAEQLQLASFTQQAMLKMLTFVDFIVTPNLSYQVFISDRLLPVPVGALYQKLHTLIRVCAVLSEVLSKIRLAFDSSSSKQVARIQGEIISVLSAKQGKVGKAIWNAVVDISTQILKTLEDGQGSSDTQTPQGPSDIDEATKSVMIYVMFLENYHSVMEPIVSDAASLGKYVPRSGDLPTLTSLEVEMVSCLGEKLANKSEALPNQGLRFLFLLNNSSFIADQLHQNASYFPKSYKVDLAGKVEGYMERYMQVSWAPVLSCLINPTPSCFGKNYTPLPKFESKFQKMYTTQKLWKVPDHRLRNWLRRAIIDKVIPCYTRYLADGYGNTPLKFSPSNLQEMLQELFEG